MTMIVMLRQPYFPRIEIQAETEKPQAATQRDTYSCLMGMMGEKCKSHAADHQDNMSV